MNTNYIFKLTDDIISASNLVLSHYRDEGEYSGIYKTNYIIDMLNMGCIKNTDKVLVRARKVDTIVWGLSYISKPETLIVNKMGDNGLTQGWFGEEEKRWNDICQLLSGYSYTDPCFSSEAIDKLDNNNKKHDVIISAFIDSVDNIENSLKGRFDFESGALYEVFEKTLIDSSNKLRKEGRLLILSKPSWILKAWQIIDGLGLQLDYRTYRIYSDGDRNPNAWVWLRFTKRNHEFNRDLQKDSVLALLKDNSIDRLFAHRNNLLFPYVELSFNPSKAYVELEENSEYLQYFFSAETTKKLAELCNGYTACLVTPSIAKYAYNINKKVVLFERDNRFRENKGLSYVKYDLHVGLTQFVKNRYEKKFDTVICDPPFDINLKVLARDIVELLKEEEDSVVYVVFPQSRKASLANAMAEKGLHIVEEEENSILIEYSRPPKIVRVNGKQAIQVYKFTYNE